jgi:hypothetical protein
VLFGRKPRGERGVLLVPVLPGAVLRSAEPALEREPTSQGEHGSQGEPASQRVLPVAAGLGGTLALIAVAVLLFARGSETKHPLAESPLTVAGATPVVVPHAPPHPPKPIARRVVSAAARAHAAAVKLAARLPVAIESAAVLRSGSTLYLVGGTTRSGAPSDGIWQVDSRSGRVTSAGRFIEPLTASAAASRDGVLYLAGGWTGEKLATGVLRWSPGQSSSLVTRLPLGLRGAHAAFVGSTLYVVSADGANAYAVDVETGSLSPVTKVPPQLGRPTSNLAALAAAFQASG